MVSSDNIVPGDLYTKVKRYIHGDTTYVGIHIRIAVKLYSWGRGCM